MLLRALFLSFINGNPTQGDGIGASFVAINAQPPETARWPNSYIDQDPSRSSTSFGTLRGSRIIRRAGSRRLVEIMRLLRNSEIGRRDYERLPALWRDCLNGDASSPASRETRRISTERFNLDDEIPTIDRFNIVDTCGKQAFGSPKLLDKVGKGAFSKLTQQRQLQKDAIQLAGSVILLFTDFADGDSISLIGASPEAGNLLKRQKASPLSDSSVRRAVFASHAKLRMRESFRNLGQSPKLAKIRLAPANRFEIRRFFRTSPPIQTKKRHQKHKT